MVQHSPQMHRPPRFMNLVRKNQKTLKREKDKISEGREGGILLPGTGRCAIDVTNTDYIQQ